MNSQQAIVRTPCNVIIPSRRRSQRQDEQATTLPLESGSRPCKPWRVNVNATVVKGKRSRSAPLPVVFSSDHVAHVSQALANEWEAAIGLIRSRKWN